MGELPLAPPDGGILFVAHVIMGETSSLRLSVLRFYARREVRLLALIYRFLNSRLMQSRVARELVYWLLVLPSARWAISVTPHGASGARV